MIINNVIEFLEILKKKNIMEEKKHIQELL